MPKTLKTFASFQAARAVAALLVVFYHCFVIFDQPKYWNYSWDKYLFFGDSGVEFFFVLSGIVILNAHWADRGHPEALRVIRLEEISADLSYLLDCISFCHAHILLNVLPLVPVWNENHL